MVYIIMIYVRIKKLGLYDSVANISGGRGVLFYFFVE
jgi:hypothetical protein